MNLRPDLLRAPAYHFTARPQTVKLDQNESPYNLPEALKKRVLERISSLDFNRYPDINGYTLRQRLAEQIRWPAEGIVLSGGSNILIQAFVMAAGIGRSVLSVKPTFSVYPLQAGLQGAKLLECALNDDFSLPLAELKRHLANDQGVFFLANPAAPTGNLFSSEDLEDLALASADNWLFVIDEAYCQFSGTDFSQLVKRHPHVVCLRTFSKAFGLGGVRLGYALMQETLAEQIQKVVMPFSVSALQLAVGEVVLEHRDYAEARVREALVERSKLFAHLQSLDTVTPYESATNFILFRVPDAEAVYNSLLDKGIVIRRQDHLPGLSGCLRVSVGKPEENEAFMTAITDISQTVVDHV